MKVHRIRTNYVKKLRKMLSKKDPYSRCPYFFQSFKKCSVCVSFIGLSALNRLCPCIRLGCTKALDRAGSAILEWDLGKHKWQTEE